MTNKQKYRLLFPVLIVLAVAGAVVYFYNKPPANIKDARARKVPAAELYATFIKDSSAATKNFTNKILEVSGTVAGLAENQQHQTIVLLKTATEGAAVNCTMEGPSGNIKTGQRQVIKGICNGIGEGDTDLGIMGDVYLVRCYVSQ